MDHKTPVELRIGHIAGVAQLCSACYCELCLGKNIRRMKRQSRAGKWENLRVSTGVGGSLSAEHRSVRPAAGESLLALAAGARRVVHQGVQIKRGIPVFVGWGPFLSELGVQLRLTGRVCWANGENCISRIYMKVGSAHFPPGGGHMQSTIRLRPYVIAIA